MAHLLQVLFVKLSINISSIPTISLCQIPFLVYFLWPLQMHTLSFLVTELRRKNKLSVK